MSKIIVNNQKDLEKVINKANKNDVIYFNDKPKSKETKPTKITVVDKKQDPKDLEQINVAEAWANIPSFLKPLVGGFIGFIGVTALGTLNYIPSWATTLFDFLIVVFLGIYYGNNFYSNYKKAKAKKLEVQE